MDKVTVGTFRYRLINLYNELGRAEVKAESSVDEGYEDLHDILKRYDMMSLKDVLEF